MQLYICIDFNQRRCIQTSLKNTRLNVFPLRFFLGFTFRLRLLSRDALTKNRRPEHFSGRHQLCSLSVEKYNTNQELRVRSSYIRITSSNPRVASSNTRVRALKAQFAKSKAQVGRLNARVRRLKARVQAINLRVKQ